MCAACFCAYLMLGALPAQAASELEGLGDLTELAFEFGPFLFAILVLLVITQRTHKAYTAITARTDPPAKKGELDAHRFAFRSSWIAAWVLLAVAVGWWIYNKEHHEKNYVTFRIIKLVEPRESLKPRDDEVYHRTKHFSDTNDYYFLVLAEDEQKGHKIHIDYYDEERKKGDTIVHDLKELKDEEFMVEMQDGKPVLKKLAGKEKKEWTEKD